MDEFVTGKDIFPVYFIAKAESQSSNRPGHK